MKAQTDAVDELLGEESRTALSPTGLGSISSGVDSKMPMYGIASLEAAHGRRPRHGRHAAEDRRPTSASWSCTSAPTAATPYDGEVWSWSPAELNRIAYVDGEGDLWVARADGRDARRLLKGDFTLPAWSDDGKAIAVAERKDGGRRWDISVVLLPENLRSVR